MVDGLEAEHKVRRFWHPSRVLPRAYARELRAGFQGHRHQAPEARRAPQERLRGRREFGRPGPRRTPRAPRLARFPDRARARRLGRSAPRGMGAP